MEAQGLVKVLQKILVTLVGRADDIEWMQRPNCQLDQKSQQHFSKQVKLALVSWMSQLIKSPRVEKVFFQLIC